MFPEKKDIQRLIDMQSADCGFFVLSVYSFIEMYMRTQANSTLGKTYDTNDENFVNLIHDYVDVLKERQRRKGIPNWGYIPESQFSFLTTGMKNGKDNSNDVRHTFKSLSPEEAKCAIKDLLQFCRIDNGDIKKQFEPLENCLSNWMQRKFSEEDAKELVEANKKIIELQNSNENLILQTANIETLKKQLQELQQDNDIYDEMQNELLEKIRSYDEYISNLRRMIFYTRTRNDFEKFIVRLSAEQQQAVDRIKFKKDYLIKGSAGTGKSFVLLTALKKLLEEKLDEDQYERLVFITYTKSLAKYNAYVASLMEMGVPEENIITADKFFVEICNHCFPKKRIIYFRNEDKPKYSEKCINRIKLIIKEKKFDDELDASEIFAEAEMFIWPNLITKEEYIEKKIERKGMKTPLKVENRQKYWEIIERLEESLTYDSDWEQNFAKVKLAHYLKENPLSPEEKNYDYVFVDEVQDLPISEMACFKAYSKESVILAGDEDQSIYRVQMPIIRSGIDIVGNSITLHTNFRNTFQINEVAEKYRSMIKGRVSESAPAPFRLGPPVELIDLKDGNELFSTIVNRVKMCISDLEYEPGNICIVMNSQNKDRYEKLMELLLQSGIKSEGIKDKKFTTENLTNDKVVISTLQSVKGFDFPVVILVADDSIRVTTYDEENNDKIHRNLLYVALTRAMDMLTVITCNSLENVAIEDLKKCISEVCRPS